MDNPELLTLGVSLAELAVKGTVTAVSAKVSAIKTEKNVESIRNRYDEIINELLLEREEAIRIAQAYKSELEKVVISDEDITHLHNTVSRLIEWFKPFHTISAVTNGKSLDDISNEMTIYEQLKELISVDTLKTMQLLGFNYKSAIGEPLTKICADAILSLNKNQPVQKGNASGQNKAKR